MSITEQLKSNWLKSILIMFLYILQAFSGIMGQYLFKYALDDITQGQINGYIFWQLLEAIMELAAAVLLPIAAVVFTRQTQDYLHSIRQEIVHNYYNGKDKKVSEMQNDLSGNLKILTDNYANSWVVILSGLLQIVMAIAVLISMNWILILVTAILTALTLSVPKIMEKKTAQATDRVNKKTEKLLNAIEHWFGGLDELRRYRAYGRLGKTIRKSSDELVDANKKNVTYAIISESLNGFVNILTQIVLLFVAGILFFANKISFGDFVVASGFAFTIFGSMWDITDVLIRIKSTKTLRNQTFELRKKVKSESKQPAYGLKVANLVAKYDQGESIEYPDFEVKPGEKVLLTGDSGTGKSTLFKLLLGKLQPASGQIEYLDQSGDVIKEDKSKVGFVPQDPVVFPVSIKENILMFNSKLAGDLDRVVSKVCLEKDLKKFPDGLNTQVDLKKENLSGGQRQKVVLARSEVHSQPFVLMDEVTSAIDKTNTEKIIDEILKSDKTILMIAHNFSDELKAKFDKEIKLKAKKMVK